MNVLKALHVLILGVLAIVVGVPIVIVCMLAGFLWEFARTGFEMGIGDAETFTQPRGSNEPEEPGE